MISLLCRLLTNLIGRLPASPLNGVVTALDGLDSMMGWLNWVVPFKACFAIMSAWCACLAVWYVYKHLKSIIMKLI
ncbi:MAG: hypothetical protein LUG27_04410 [Clostridiales bacterium]|nr:hypothetical protein [Clostridiales bacterium]